MSLEQLLPLIGVALLGAILGAIVNWAIGALAWFNPRPISPWSRDPERASGTILRYVPIAGWFFRGPDQTRLGRGFHVRSLLLEFAMALGLVALWIFEHRGAFSPLGVPLVSISFADHTAQFAARAVLIAFMLAATFIDFDEQTIPDSITIPGTLIGLCLMCAMPFALPWGVNLSGPNPAIQPLWFSGEGYPPRWAGELRGLAFGAACFVAWCYALVPKTCTLRYGLLRAWRYVHVSTVRSPAFPYLAGLAVFGSLAILAVWRLGGTHWHSLLTSLIGMAFGGALVWAVRIVGFVALRKEAMGFGDVTLMAMIGTFLGWQATIVVFLLAPFAAVVIAVTQWLITRRHDIAFGPYLCGGALLLIVRRRQLWDEYAGPLFDLPMLILGVLCAGLLAMMGLLMLWRLLQNAFFPEPRD